MLMQYSYTVPCLKEKLEDIRNFISDILIKHGLSEVDANTLVLAIDEVCANLIIHAHEGNPNDTLEVDVKLEKNKGVTFKIIDTGKSFDIRNYNAPSLDELIKQKRKGGIGLILVKKIMDEIEYKTINNKNTCKLFKKIEIH